MEAIGFWWAKSCDLTCSSFLVFFFLFFSFYSSANDPIGDILLIYPIVGNLYRSWSGSKSSSFNIYNLALIETFLLEDIWTFWTDESWFKKLCLIDIDDSPLLDTFFDLAIGLLLNTLYLLFFWVATEDLEIRIKLLYLAAIYLFHSRVFLYSDSGSIFFSLATNEFPPLVPIVLLPNLG